RDITIISYQINNLKGNAIRSDWIQKPKEFLESLSNFIGSKENKEISEYMKGAGGLISFGIGIAKLIQEYRNSLLSDYEKSLGDLFSFLFSFTSSYITEICLKQGLRKEDLSLFKTSNIKRELNDIVLSYKKRLESADLKLESPWLPLHPVIQ